MLPDNYYKAEHVKGAGNDAAFITEQLEQITLKQRESACEHYSTIYSEQGRSAANTRLRKFIEKCVAKNKGCTVRLKAI